MNSHLNTATGAFLLPAALLCAPAIADSGEAQSRYTLQSRSGEEVVIQRRPDGSFDLEFEPRPKPADRPGIEGLGDEELVISLPEPIASRLVAQWREKMPVGTTANGWFVLRFERPGDRDLRAMVMSDIAERMGWKGLSHEKVGTLYLRPDVMKR